jgi:hypothetical protein
MKYLFIVSSTVFTVTMINLLVFMTVVSCDYNQPFNPVIELDSLQFKGTTINRTLLYESPGGMMELTPTLDGLIVIQSHRRCVDTGEIAHFIFTDGTKVELNSFNSYNCSGLTLFKWFSPEQIEQIKVKDLEIISIFGLKGSVTAFIRPENKDYLRQMVLLY